MSGERVSVRERLALALEGADWGPGSLPADAALAVLTDPETVAGIAEMLRRIHFDGTACGDPQSPGACSNCFGPSPMTADEIAQAVAAHLRGGAA